eukprot:5708191-Amphidinium_carterae.2
MQTCRSAARFYRRHDLQDIAVNQTVQESNRQQTRFTRPHAFAGRSVYCWWLLVCMLTSAPNALYSVVKAVPGFLQVSAIGQWVIGSAVTFSGATTKTEGPRRNIGERPMHRQFFTFQ